MLIGNKCDMEDKRAVQYEEGEALGSLFDNLSQTT